MPSFSHARAKIQTPRFRSGLIERGDLERQLGDALSSRRVVLLVAPAGYGKTAALSRQLQRLPPGCAAAWLTVDEEDDLQRFLSYLIEALEPFDPPWRMAPEGLLGLVAQGRLRDAATVLLGALESTGTSRGVIVLDDLHAVADALVFDFLGLLIDGLPAHWTIAIATRVEPSLSLGRWRARREVAEFDQDALSFSRDEVQALWRSTTGKEDPEQARRLHDRTRGWAAGLCLSLEAAEGSAVSAPTGIWQNRRHLFDYLASEVLEHLPEELQQFLLRCSVLSELTAPRCEQVSGNPRAAELLEEIERRRLFVSMLDSDNLTLRQHDLFRDFLEERLRRLHPAEVPALLRRAAEGEADPVRRTLMYLRAGAWDEAQQGLADATQDMLASGEGAQVIRIVEQFPAEVQAQSPLLAYARGLCAWQQYHYGAARAAMARAAAGFDVLGRRHEAQRARAMQALAMFFSGQMDEAKRLGQSVRRQPMDLETETLSELLDFWYEGHHGAAEGPGSHLDRVVSLLLQGGSAELWFRCMPRVNMLISRPGVSAQIQRLVDGARAAAGDGHWSLQAAANLMEAWLLLWHGRLADMEAAFERIEEDSHWLGQPAGLRIRLLTLKVMYHVICDDKEAARATCESIAAYALSLDRSGDLPVTFLAIVVRISAAIGDWQTVRRYLPMLDLEIGRENPCIQMFIRTFKAQLALHEKRVDEALTTLRELAQSSARLDTNCLDATVRTRLALAELAKGSTAAAWRALEPLVRSVAATGLVGQVLVTGQGGLHELAGAAWGQDAPEQGIAALRGWIETARNFKSGVPERSPASQGHDAGLSARELQVLALLAEGLSNKLIARHLDLSPHTVKRHVARILERLDLSSRMQAANWYHARYGD